jgi:hypothetical protein
VLPMVSCSQCSGSGGGGDGSYLCSTPPSRDGVECVFAFTEAVVTEAAMVERSGVVQGVVRCWLGERQSRRVNYMVNYLLCGLVAPSCFLLDVGRASETWPNA